MAYNNLGQLVNPAVSAPAASNYQTFQNAVGAAVGGDLSGLRNLGYSDAAIPGVLALQGHNQLGSNITGQLSQFGGGAGVSQGGQIGATGAGIPMGYQQLTTDVLNGIQGTQQAQQQAIDAQYAAAKGQASQDMANRGLGNSTVNSSVQRGLTLDQQKAGIDLSNQMAQLAAGYRSNIGLAGLGAWNQTAMMAQNAAANSHYLTNMTGDPNFGQTAQSMGPGGYHLPPIGNPNLDTRTYNAGPSQIGTVYGGGGGGLGANPFDTPETGGAVQPQEKQAPNQPLSFDPYAFSGGQPVGQGKTYSFGNTATTEGMTGDEPGFWNPLGGFDEEGVGEIADNYVPAPPINMMTDGPAGKNGSYEDW